MSDWATGLLLPGAMHLVAALAVMGALAFRRAAPAGLRRWRPAIAALLLWSWVFSTPGFANLALVALEGPPAAPAPRAAPGAAIVLVLGSGRLHARDGTPAPRLNAEGWERLRSGIALWRAAGGTLVLAGGPVPGRSLAELMRDAAVEAGVPAEAIRVVATSRDTHEDITGARGFTGQATGPVLLVTSALHMRRAVAVARHAGMRVDPQPCDFRQIVSPTWRAWLPDDGGPALWAGPLHEIAGLLYYRLRGWAE